MQPHISLILWCIQNKIIYFYGFHCKGFIDNQVFLNCCIFLLTGVQELKLQLNHNLINSSQDLLLFLNHTQLILPSSSFIPCPQPFGKKLANCYTYVNRSYCRILCSSLHLKLKTFWKMYWKIEAG